ncbi:hypothetical protein [Nostoc parmelioides]|uniref:AMIN domain-containing protein n=1 Tax=Nostoc parmelioides FACHB-3921 TaxID=2692909 RepID=A0ABR8BG08_9NOSO|nr:hypothetical protein [Nostoc parmelioides]MBD2253017.1 hypothetical protein [Nostoc parmelioides FACHB-3921]
MSINFSDLRKSADLLSAICVGLLMGISATPQPGIAQQPVTQQSPIQPNSKVNPCPRIFYEQPHNERVAVPQGCPPNAFTQRLIDQGLLPQSSVPATPNADQIRMGVGGDTSSVLNPNPRIFSEAPYGRSQRGLQTEGENTQLGVPGSQQTPAPGAGQSTVPVSPLPSPGQQQSPSTRISLASGRVNVRLVNDSGANVTYQVIGDTAPRSLQGKSDVTLQGLTVPVTVTFQREDGGLLQATPQPSPQSGVLEVRLRETTDVGQDRSALRIENNGSVFLN